MIKLNKFKSNALIAINPSEISSIEEKSHYHDGYCLITMNTGNQYEVTGWLSEVIIKINEADK